MASGLRISPGELLAKLRAKGPLVQCIQNQVAMDITANALNAAGASPAMVSSELETPEFVMIAEALSVNMGTLTQTRLSEIEVAVEAAGTANKPWVMDPVGCGSSPFRLDACRAIGQKRPNVMRGNASEIITLAGALTAAVGARTSGKGVDSTDSTMDALKIAVNLTQILSNVVVVTGEVDLVTDGNLVVMIRNGVPEITKVSAIGCALSAITAAFCVVSDGMYLEAAVAACALVGVSSEGAKCTAPGSLRVHWMDTLNTITPEQLDKAAKIRVVDCSAQVPMPELGGGGTRGLDMKKVHKDCEEIFTACLIHPFAVLYSMGSIQPEAAKAYQANANMLLASARPSTSSSSEISNAIIRFFELLDSCSRVQGATHIVHAAIACVQATVRGSAKDDGANREAEVAARMREAAEDEGKKVPHNIAVAYYKRALKLQLEIFDSSGEVPFLPAVYAKGVDALASSPMTSTIVPGRPTRVLLGTPPRVLIVAGSDSGGGAGIQADIKACEAFGVFSMTAVTALTAQNSQGVQGVWAPSADFLKQQVVSCLSDFGSDVIKTGMISSPADVEALCAAASPCELYKWVVDPVMVSTSGHNLVGPETVTTIKSKLFPLAWIITPNLPEAAMLLGRDVNGREGMVVAARHLSELGPRWVLIKGGHSDDNGDGLSADLLYESSTGKQIWFSNQRIPSQNTHGTGCTLASSIAACLARGMSTPVAVEHANAYVWDAIRAASRCWIGSGHGPLHHSFCGHDWSSSPARRQACHDARSSSLHRGKEVNYSVYAVTDEDCIQKAGGGNVTEAVHAAIKGGATVVQLRMKDAGGNEMLRVAKELVPVCRAAGIPLIINDRIDVAVAADADGAHVGQSDMPAADARKVLGYNKILGVSCKTVELALKAQRDGADYVGCGAVWGTNTKDTTVVGLEGLGQVAKSTTVPVVAIGGVNDSNAAEAIAAGAAGVAVVSAIFGKADIEKAAATVAASVESARLAGASGGLG